MQAFIYQKTKRQQRPKKHLQMMPIHVYELEEADDEFLAHDDEQSKRCFNGSGRARSQKRVIATPWPFETVETIAESAQNSDPSLSLA